MKTRRILITGCSAGGKSTLLAALAAAGHRVVTEPGRRIVAEELAGDGRALPWVDMAAFARRAVDMARADLDGLADFSGTVFFDRGLIDAAIALHHAAGVPVQRTLGDRRPYNDPVFLAPPWPELFKQDAERRHDLKEAREEYDRIAETLHRLGYQVRLLPKVSVEARMAFVLGQLG
ncbi:AAA family ATPase [Halovulum sp. GXIMD14793]